MPEIIVQRVIQRGIAELRDDADAFNTIFGGFLHEMMLDNYGQSYIDQIRTWFNSTKIPVVQAWSFNPTRIPCVSIHLSSETEDESKASIGDYIGDNEDNTVGTAVFTVYVDVGIHANKDSDQVLWLYYILAYIFFKQKRLMEQFDIQLHTWSASDYSKQDQYKSENIWTRWIKFKCTTQNFFDDESKDEYEVDMDIEIGRVGVDD